jgi:hypothetical protein
MKQCEKISQVLGKYRRDYPNYAEYADQIEFHCHALCQQICTLNEETGEEECQLKKNPQKFRARIAEILFPVTKFDQND